MPLTSMFFHRITTYRLRAGTGVQKSYTANLRSLPCFIQPMSAEFSTKIDMVFGKSYYCYTSLNADLKQGDKVIDQDGKEYRVSGSQKRNYGSQPNLTFYLSEQAGDGAN